MAKLLVVDDDAAMLDMLTQACRVHGHLVESTNDPRIALRIFRTDDDVLPFDLVITDFNMAPWSGLTLALHIRNVDVMSERRTPILCITGNVVDTARLNQGSREPIDRIWDKGDFSIDTFERIIQEMIHCGKDDNANA